MSTNAQTQMTLRLPEKLAAELKELAWQQRTS